MTRRIEDAPQESEPVSRGHRRAQTWTVLYDAECGFCAWVLAGLLRWDRARRLRPVALQGTEAGQLLADVPAAERMASWHLVSPGGARYSGGAAGAEALRLLPGGRVPAWVFARFPGNTEKGYRWVARHRVQISRLVPAGAKRKARGRIREGPTTGPREAR